MLAIGDESSTASLHVGESSGLYEAAVDGLLLFTTHDITVDLFNEGDYHGSVKVVLERAISTANQGGGPAPAGGGTPGVDIAVSRVGMVSSGSSDDYHYYGQVDGVSAFSAGTTSCNVGTVVAQWISGNSGRHPVIAQNVYRCNDGTFVQIGQSWLKHSFCAVSEPTCGNC